MTCPGRKGRARQESEGKGLNGGRVKLSLDRRMITIRHIGETERNGSKTENNGKGAREEREGTGAKRERITEKKERDSKTRGSPNFTIGTCPLKTGKHRARIMG